MIRSTDLCVHHSAPPTNRRCPPSPNSGVDMKVGEYGGKKGREVNEVQRRWDQKGPNGQEQRSWKPCEMRGKSHLSESHLIQDKQTCVSCLVQWRHPGHLKTSWTLPAVAADALNIPQLMFPKIPWPIKCFHGDKEKCIAASPTYTQSCAAGGPGCGCPKEIQL